MAVLSIGGALAASIVLLCVYKMGGRSRMGPTDGVVVSLGAAAMDMVFP